MVKFFCSPNENSVRVCTVWIHWPHTTDNYTNSEWNEHWNEHLKSIAIWKLIFFEKLLQPHWSKFVITGFELRNIWFKTIAHKYPISFRVMHDEWFTWLRVSCIKKKDQNRISFELTGKITCTSIGLSQWNKHILIFIIPSSPKRLRS